MFIEPMLRYVLIPFIILIASLLLPFLLKFYRKRTKKQIRQKKSELRTLKQNRVSLQKQVNSKDLTDFEKETTKDELVNVIIEEKPAFVTLGAGNPVPYIKPLQEAGIKVIPVVPSLKLAKRIEEAGADAMIVEGMEAGGHIGSQTTMSLMENILPEISIPVVVAGSIVDGRGLAAALLMGAEGVQMGSRFLLAEECQAHQNMKEAIIKATDTDSVVTGLLSGHGGVRSLKNEFTTRYLAAETDGVTTPEERTKMSQGTNKRAAIDGDVVNGAVQVGQALNRLVAIEPAHTIVQTVMNEAIMSIRKAQRLIEIV